VSGVLQPLMIKAVGCTYLVDIRLHIMTDIKRWNITQSVGSIEKSQLSKRRAVLFFN
jgi:hypothetical protein